MSEDERNTKTTQKPEKIITTEHELPKSHYNINRFTRKGKNT